METVSADGPWVIFGDPAKGVGFRILFKGLEKGVSSFHTE